MRELPKTADEYAGTGVDMVIGILQNKLGARNEPPTKDKGPTRCPSRDDTAKEDSQAMMKAALGIGLKTGRHSWEYYSLPEKVEE